MRVESSREQDASEREPDTANGTREGERAPEPGKPANAEFLVHGRVHGRDGAAPPEDWRLETWRGTREETLASFPVEELRAFRRHDAEFSFVADRSAPLLIVRARSHDAVSAPRRLEPSRLQSGLEIELVLNDGARVHGRVAPRAESKLEGLPVLLTSRIDPKDPVARVAGATTLTAKCDADGNFAFETVAIGTYRVSVGSLSAPLAVASNVELHAPETELPELSTPPLFAKSFRILDELGNAIADAHVTGDVRTGGHVEFTTDPSGRGTATFLTAGSCRLFAWDTRRRRGNEMVEIADDGNELEVRIPFREMGTGQAGR